DYRGHVNSTSSGYTCQAWSLQTPHAHTFTPERYPTEGIGEHNYCRAVGSSWAWCFTTVEKPGWQYCRVGARQSACGA
ncbi:plasminogen Kringle 3, partial [Pavlovales sp. CCMP2436]